MTYNSGFPTNSTYQSLQAIPQVGYTQPVNNQLNMQGINNNQVQQPLFNQITDERIMVNGLDNVRLYPIAPNRTETLWDIDGKTFYRVTANATPRIFTYEEVTSPVIPNNITVNNETEHSDNSNAQNKEDLTQYVKIDDLNDMLNDMINDIIDDRLSNKTEAQNSVSQNGSKQTSQKRSMKRTRKDGE